MAEDALQLRRFVETGDEEAFRDLVSRHFALVYGTALRQANGEHPARADVGFALSLTLSRQWPGVPQSGGRAKFAQENAESSLIV